MNKRLIKILFVIAAMTGFFLSSVSFASEPIVESIEFAGNKRTSEETIRAALKTAKGERFDIDKIDFDIRSIYATGQFRDIRVESTAMPGGVKLTYILDEKPIVAEISFEGNRKIKSEDLREEVTQHAFTPLDEHAVAESMEKIRAAYAKKGYYLAAVDYHMDHTPEGDEKLVFDIHEKGQVIVRRVNFIGNKVFKDKLLRGVIRTREKTAFSFLTKSGKYEDEMIKNDSLFLAYHYLNNGYLKVKISPPKVTISKDKRYIFVSFQIHEGSQYRIGDVSLTGDILTTPEELKSLLKTKKGNIYSQKDLEEDVAMLTDRYGDEGYAYANIVPQTIPNDETLTADIAVPINKGKRITIERINISGNTTTRDKVIRREMLLKENDRYNERFLNASRENLMRLGFFEEVNFATPRGSRDDTMILNVSVKEKPTGSFGISAGFSTFESFIFNASIQKENFFGYGVGGMISAELSKKRQLFMLSANDPYFLDSKWAAGFSVYRSAFDYTDFRRTSIGGDVSLGHRFFDHFQANVGYQLEDVKVDDFSFAVPQVFQQDSSGFTSAISLTILRDTRNNMINPTKGFYSAAAQEVSGSKIGGTNDFYRVNFRNMFYQPIWKTIVFKQLTRVGWIKSLNNRPVPLFERFFTGGPNSLRGYFANSIGPSLKIPATASLPVTNFVYGGDKLLLLVAELELPIYDKAGLRAVAFFDAGNTYSENENYSITNIRTDYGFGVRWNSPMGPLRFEWGFPIARRAGEDSVQFNFSIGNYF